MKKGKYKYLLQNVGLLTLSNFGSKVLSIILIPLYTSILSTTEYGAFDVVSTTISLLIPILTLSVTDAVMRFLMDKKADNCEVITIGVKRIIFSTLIVIFLVMVNKILGLIKVFNDFAIFFVFTYISEIIYSFCVEISKGMEKIKVLAVGSFINSFVTLVGNLLFLIVFKFGIKGYFIANIISYIMASLYIMLRLNVKKKVKLNSSNSELAKKMNKYSIPMTFNTISWWINNVSDRYIVTWISGLAANGIYSISYKIPSLLNVMQSIFNQAWTISAVKEFEKNDEKEVFFHNIYMIYNIAFILICSFLIMTDKLIAKILFAKEFYDAWRYAPFLMISVVFGALSGLLGGIFTASKKTKEIANTTIIGATVNIVLNVVLVKIIGPIGAAIATLISYIVVWKIRVVKVKCIVNIHINEIKDICTYAALIIQAIMLILIENAYLYQCFIIGIIILLNYKEIKKIINGIIKKFERGKNEN